MASALAGLCYSALFTGAGYLGPLCAAAVGAALVAVASARWWSAPELTLAAATVGFALCAEVLLFPSDVWHGRLIQATTGLLDALSQGWGRMVTVTPPVAATPGLLCVPLLLAWASGFLSVLLAQRGDWILAPAVPVLAAVTAALALTAGVPGSHVVLAVVVLALLALLGAIRRARVAQGPAGRPEIGVTPVPGARGVRGAPVRVHVRRAGAAGTAAVLVVAAGVLSARSAVGGPAAHRVGAQSLAHASVRTRNVMSPLAAVRAQLLARSSQPLFTVRVDGAAGAPRPLRIQVASFGYFNGVLWSSRGAFPVTGGALSSGPVLARPRLLTEEFDVTSLPGPYLPTIGWPLQVAFAGPAGGDQLGYDAASGTLVTSRNPWPGLSYKVIAETAGTDLPSSAQPGPLTVLGQDLGSPVALTAQETARVRHWVAGRSTPYLALTAVARHLRDLPYTPLASPGESYAAVRQLLSGRQPADDGYDEQHAAAFTLIARWLGYPARVVVGYLAQLSRTGVYTVTGADARAWSEVYFTGYGWVPFDPTYPVLVRAKALPALPAGPALGPRSPAAAPTVLPTPPVTPAHSALSVPQVPAQPAATTGNSPSPGRLAWVIAAVLGVSLLGVAGWRLNVAVAKARRRARRRQGTPAEQVTGAWHEALDRLTEYGMTVGASMTAGQAARYASQALPAGARAAAAALGSLAITHTRAVFGPDDCAHDDAIAAWRDERGLTRALYPRPRSWRRLRALLNPRPLRSPAPVARRAPGVRP